MEEECLHDAGGRPEVKGKTGHPPAAVVWADILCMLKNVLSMQTPTCVYFANVDS